MTKGESCSILLATCNGAAYLPALLSSFNAQTCRPGRLVLRDDGSEDATLDMLRKYRAACPDLVTIIEDNCGRLGTAGNFTNLLGHADSNYILFCDQDDVWLPGKIEKTLSVMAAAEDRYGSDTPLLVHSDLSVVDRDLQPIAPSFWKYQKLNPQVGISLNRLLPQNAVTGCTVMINRPLARLAAPIPRDAIMHDWWLALVAATFGKIVYLDEPTVLYRQHGGNSIGAKRWGFRRILAQAQSTQEVRASMLRTMKQAQALLDRYRDHMTPSQIKLVESYAHLPYMSKIERVKTMFKYRFFKHGTIRTIGFLANLLALDQAAS
ncbi:glycosyltransferase family 2 protein [Geobacter luticola]|uniref:Glycosyltransferase family 2 protein n=2 Tax=Geomobilimonas luticola TaxID=1114878 RepID=A0ABS5SFQ4_9BACT|nr:glycosyltransferase family 2 protein [Geomobilimonas luticola]MBT0654203.1 glycosyltransferase family 2 protein [Geomobilimonas luticola]